MENKIKETLNALYSSIEEEIEKDNKNKVEELLGREDLDWKDPENINVMYYFKENSFLKSLIKKIYPELSELQYSKVCFIYEQYSFLKNQITKLVDLGTGCCADKTRWIIQQYLIQSTGDVPFDYPERRNPEHKYYYPDFASIYEWMAYCEELYKMYYYGQNENLERIYRSISNKKRVEKNLLEEDNKAVAAWIPKIEEKIIELENCKKISDIGMLPNTLAKMVSANLYQEILSGNIDESRIDKEIIDITEKNSP